MQRVFHRLEDRLKRLWRNSACWLAHALKHLEADAIRALCPVQSQSLQFVFSPFPVGVLSILNSPLRFPLDRLNSLPVLSPESPLLPIVEGFNVLCNPGFVVVVEDSAWAAAIDIHNLAPPWIHSSTRFYKAPTYFGPILQRQFGLVVVFCFVCKLYMNNCAAVWSESYHQCSNQPQNKALWNSPVRPNGHL